MLKLSRILFRAAWFGYVLLMLYGTFYPFHFHFTLEQLALRSHGINWFPLTLFSNPKIGYIDWVDYAINILLFTPFGFFGYLSLLHEDPRRKLLRLVILGFLFSVSIESMQLFTETRDTSLTDVIWNTLSTLNGVLIGVGFNELMVKAR